MRPGLFIFLLLIASNVMAAKTPLIVGVWRHPEGGVVIARPDGTLHTSIWKGAEGKGRWSAADKKGYDYIFRWQNKTKNADQIKVSRDGKSYAGFNNQFNTVIRWKMVRDSYPPPEKATKKKPAKPVRKQPARQNKTKARIPRDAVKYKGHYYKVVDGRLSWFESQEQCKKNGGHLVRINNKSEQLFIQNLIDQLRNRKTLDFWTDLHLNQDGRWAFSDGKTANFFNWYPGGPQTVKAEYQGAFNNLKWSLATKPRYVIIGWNEPSQRGSIEQQKWGNYPSDHRCGFICEWDTANRGAKVEDIDEEREEPQFEEPEEEPKPFSLDDEPEQQPLKPFSLDDDPDEEEAGLLPPTDPEGILDRAGLYEGRPGVWYLKRANNFANRVYERLSKSSEIRSALTAVNGRLPTEAEMNNPPSKR